jgi:hypothetical protein
MLLISISSWAWGLRMGLGPGGRRRPHDIHAMMARAMMARGACKRCALAPAAQDTGLCLHQPHNQQQQLAGWW